MTTAHEALEWMENKADGQSDRLLFRGQNRVWPTIKPSITRLDEHTMRDMWAICRKFISSAADGITGYHIPNEHDRLAILQHYIGAPLSSTSPLPRRLRCILRFKGRNQIASALSIRSIVELPPPQTSSFQITHSSRGH